jgi:predicted amidophosphoribosyltransferase
MLTTKYFCWYCHEEYAHGQEAGEGTRQAMDGLCLECFAILEKHKQDKEEPKYIYAEDPTIKKRTVHVIKGGYAISMVTGHKFKFTKEDERQIHKR